VQLVAGCIHVICRRCARLEEAKVPGEVGFACPFCARKCAIEADKLVVDVGTVARLQEQETQQQQLEGGKVVAVPDCDVCGDDPATK
jgi:anaerobic selenocysteine-containing dehydrogenase